MTEALPLTPAPNAGDDVLPPGARVVIRDEEWLVRGAHRSAVGGQAVEVIGLSELVRNQSAVFLTKLDEVTRLRPESTALVHDPSAGYRRTRLYLESLLRRTPPTDARLHIGHHAAATTLPYQLEPAAKALALPRARLLIADDVGLGKTVEVGILLAELIRRGQGRRILVVTLKSILGQFQRELWHRFTLPLVALDSAGIERMRARIPATTNPFQVFDRVIVSVDTLKKDARYRRFLERTHWDVVVVDECQNVAVRAQGARRSQRARLASLLADTCDALVLTSATPHDGTPESFASLMNLLDPTAIADPSRYTREDVQGLFVRRFKKDVAHEIREQFQPRLEPRVEVLTASPQENDVFRALADASFPTLDRAQSATSRGGNPLFRTVLLKAFLSSPAACSATLAERHNTLKERTDPAAVSDRALLQSLGALVAKVSPEPAGTWPKFDKLLAWLAEAGWTGRGSVGERVVIFSERVDTLKRLHVELTERLGLDKRPDALCVFHGAMLDTKQDDLVADFGTEDGKTRILLASDAASEGINLHYFCHRMIHFDIPWSLITLEQRNGRIDRFGQKYPPDMRYLLTRPADPGLRGDLRVLERLIERERFVHENLGDAGWLMRCYDPVAEEKIITEAVEQHRDPLEVLPDVTPGEAPMPGDDLLAMLLGTPPDEPAAASQTTGRCVEPFSLYADDLAFARMAFEEVAVGDAATKPEFYDHLAGFSFDPPPDLQRRYALLPREFRRRTGALKLTTERPRVVASIEHARTRKGLVPEWELFWALHPVADWLCDRVLACFARNEAPVIEVARGILPDERAYVYQGVFANHRSQPRIVAWFAVVLTAKGHRVVDFEDLARAVGLAGTLSNAGRDLELAALQSRILETVSIAEAHMATLRQARSGEIGPTLQRESHRVNRWYDATLDAIDAERAHLGRAPRPDEEKRFKERETAAERARDARRRWVEDGLRTIPAPALRLAAVLVSRVVPS